MTRKSFLRSAIGLCALAASPGELPGAGPDPVKQSVLQGTELASKPGIGGTAFTITFMHNPVFDGPLPEGRSPWMTYKYYPETEKLVYEK